MKLNKKSDKKNKGITLVALVVTIIILLILAGISIAQLTGNGLFENAKLAKEKSENAQKLENETLGDYANKISEYIDGTRNENKNNYSTEEQIIGTWIDDKPIYRKVYTDLSINMSINTWVKLLDVNDLSIDMLINAIMYRNSDKAIANHCCFNIFEEHYLAGFITHAPQGYFNTIIIEYTKTTN